MKIIITILFLFTVCVGNVHSEIVDYINFIPESIVNSVDSTVRYCFGRNTNWPVDRNTKVKLYSKGRKINEMTIPEDLRRVWNNDGFFYKLEKKQKQVKGQLRLHFKIINPQYLQKTSEVILGIPGFLDTTYSLEKSCKMASDLTQLSSIVLDPVGSGLSYIPTSDEPFSVIDNKDSILEFINGMGFSKVYVISNSLGGTYTLLSMIDQPDLFGGSLLVSPVVYNIREKPNKYLYFMNYIKFPYNGHSKEFLSQNFISTVLMVNKGWTFGLIKSVRSDQSLFSWFHPSVWYERWPDVKHYTDLYSERKGLARFQIDYMDKLLADGNKVEKNYSNKMKSIPKKLRENICILFSRSDCWVREWQMYRFLSEVHNVKYFEDEELGHWGQMVKPKKIAEFLIWNCFPDKAKQNNITAEYLKLKNS